jgi:Lipopolysaccharide-assembly
MSITGFKIRLFKVAAIVACVAVVQGCMIRGNGYSLAGISIPPDVNTYYVETFENQAPGAVPTLPRDFTERLKDKIRTETRLKYNDESPDIEFTGSISDFRVTAEAPKAGEQIGFNKLTIAVQVNFINKKDEKASWKQQFSFEDFFQPEQNLLDVQEDLINNISKELVDRIYNRAFTNW